MAKDTYYFSHDYNARNDPKIRKLISVQGVTGYGVYWAIIEDLYQNANALPSDYDLIAYDLRVDVNIVKSVINDFDLFIIDDNEFGSNAVEKRLIERNEKSISARKSAFKRWNKKEQDANALPSDCDSNALKEIKEKERKEKEIIIEDELTFGNFSATFEMAWKEWIEYKKSQHNFSYKTKKTEQIAINSLIKQFPNQETKAIRAIEFSIGNGYQGIFAPNENQQSSQPQKLMNFR